MQLFSRFSRYNSQNCEILWNFETETDDRASKVRLLKPKTERNMENVDDSASTRSESEKLEKPSKGSPKNPELR